ncbi:MAG: hypothetical protein ACYC5O_21030 [Anaerolineae bacterium]
MTVGDSDILGEALQLPLKVMAVAAEHRNPSLFGSALSWYHTAYVASRERGVPNAATVADLCWRLPFEFHIGHMWSEMRSDVTSIGRVAELSQFLRITQDLLNALLKAAADLRQPDDFAAFGRALDRLSEALDAGRIDEMLMQADIKLRWVGGDDREEEARRRLRERIENFGRLRAIADEVEVHRLAIWFGHGTRLLRGIRLGKEREPERDQMLDQASAVFVSLDALVKTFFYAFDHRHDFPWYSWEYQDDAMEGEVYSPNTDRWLVEFYLTRAVQLPWSLPADGSTPIPVHPSVSYVVDVLRSMVAEFTRDSATWPATLTGVQLEKVRDFLQLNERALSGYRRQGEEELIEAEIDQEALDAFRADVAAAHRQHARLRGMLADRRRVEEVVRVELPLGHRFGLDEWEGKSPFTTGGHWPVIGSRYGEELARQEEAVVLAAIRGAALCTPADGNPVDALAAAIATMRAQGYQPSIVLMGWDYCEISDVQRSSLYVRSVSAASPSTPSFMSHGLLDGVPLHWPVRPLGSEALVIDLSRHGRLLQEPGTDGPLSIRVEPIDEKRATELVQRWRGEREARGEASPLNEEDEIRQLLQRVRLEVTERYVYSVDDAAAAVCLKSGEPAPQPDDPSSSPATPSAA